MVLRYALRLFDPMNGKALADSIDRENCDIQNQTVVRFCNLDFDHKILV